MRTSAPRQHCGSVDFNNTSSATDPWSAVSPSTTTGFDTTAPIDNPAIVNADAATSDAQVVQVYKQTISTCDGGGHEPNIRPGVAPTSS